MKQVVLKAQSRVLQQIFDYSKNGLPLLAPKNITLKKELHCILYSLAYLKIGRANYLEYWGMRNGSELNFSEGARLRKEAKALLLMLDAEAITNLSEHTICHMEKIETGRFPQDSYY